MTSKHTLTLKPKRMAQFPLQEVFASRKMAAMLALAFSAGLPIMLVYSVLSGWLREVGVSRTAIGFFVMVGFAYSLKFLWAPIIDRMRVPGFSAWLGNRKGWTLFAILATGLSMLAMSVQDPAKDLASVAVCAALIAFASATLDICVDAWRVDSAKNDEQAAMSAVYQLGYRFGMIAAVSGGLMVAKFGGFSATYAVLGLVAMLAATTPLWAPSSDQPSGFAVAKIPLCLALGLGTLLSVGAVFYLGMKDGGFLRIMGSFLQEGLRAALSPLGQTAKESLGAGFLGLIFALPFLGTLYFLTLGRPLLQSKAIFQVPIIGDFADIVKRTGWAAMGVFAMVASYRISDTTMGVMALPLYIDLGFDKAVIGLVKGAFGISVLIFGAFLGALSAKKFGLAKTMIIGAVLTIVTNLAFAWLASITVPRAAYLFVTIGADNIAAGFAGSAFIAFMSILTNKAFSASQYALFSSLFAFYGKTLAAFSGMIADKVDYVWFFVITSGFGLPALLLCLYFAKSGFTASVTEEGTTQSAL